MSEQTIAPPRPRRSRSSRLRRKQTRLAWMMLVPSLAVVALVAIYPLGLTVWQSFTNEQFLAGLQPVEFVGLDNYRALLDDPFFRDAVWLTIKFTAITVAFELVLGLIIALVVNSGFKGRGVMRAVMLVPWAIPTVVAAQMWKWMYNDIFGVFNDILIRIHVVDKGVAWIAEPSTSLAAVCAVDIWKTTPFVALLLLAGLQVIPTELYEAASVDGVSKWHQFWRITFPLLIPAILVTVIFRTLDALRVRRLLRLLRQSPGHADDGGVRPEHDRHHRRRRLRRDQRRDLPDHLTLRRDLHDRAPSGGTLR